MKCILKTIHLIKILILFFNNKIFYNFIHLYITTTAPYELFVRELIALDGSDMSEFVLIDSDGCPTDVAIMKPVLKSRESAKTLETSFEAFKFPSSDIVQFKALITPCITNCEPINCNLNLPNGRTSQSISYGRRRRRRSPSNADDNNKSDINDPRQNVIVVESLSVTDKFAVKDGKKRNKIEQNNHSEVYADFEGKYIHLIRYQFYL